MRKKREKENKRTKRNTGSMALITHVVLTSFSLRYSMVVSIRSFVGVKAALEVLQGIYLLTAHGSQPS